MISASVDPNAVHVPAWVSSLLTFRRWMRSEESPAKVPIFFLAGEVWVDRHREQLFTHNQVKKEFFGVLGGLANDDGLGTFFPNGIWMTNFEAELSGNPDAAFVSKEGFRNGRVELLEEAEGGCIEVEGSPDMVLEVVSDNSAQKDNDVLMNLYWKAGIREYWLVDARGERIEFQILRHTARGYVATRPSGGWRKSAVFGKSFRLTRQRDDLGRPDFTLDVK